MANSSKMVTRSTVNDAQYAAPEFSKSGFNLGYTSYLSYMLGRLHVSGFQWTMPGDKISGSNKGDFTFNRLVTPMVAPVDVAQYNLYLPLRALDKTFERAMVPTPLNAMSASWKAPCVSTSSLVKDILTTYGVWFNDNLNPGLLGTFIGNLYFDVNYKTLTLADLPAKMNLLGYSTYTDYLYGTSDGTRVGFVDCAVKNLTLPGGDFFQMADSMYLADALVDVADNITAKLGSIDNPLSGSMLCSDFLQLYLDCLLTPFVGRYSYYGEFKYSYLRPLDFWKIANKVGVDFTVTPSTFHLIFNRQERNEYPLRMMYVVWYERFRDINLEPVSTTLPDWHEFGSTSIFDLANGGNLCYLLYRIRPWYDDMFMSAQIDDISRHVYAPVIADGQEYAAYHEEVNNNFDAQTDLQDTFNYPKPFVYTLFYRDQLTDNDDVRVECPVPSNVNDILASADMDFHTVYGLDLNTLRQSQMLERYLKRNYLFGDEYQDRMLAHYNSRVSDMRINKPEIIGRSFNNANMSQQIANMSNGISEAGDRVATGTLSSDGDEYNVFCEEFGLVINLLCFMPRASYDGLNPQLSLAKHIDFPLPEFAANNEEFGRKWEIADSGVYTKDLDGYVESESYMFGRYPAYHAWRSRVDEVGGMFLDELQDCTFRRFWGLDSEGSTPKLNYWILHCRPNLGMFADTVAYNSQIYGSVVHDCLVERVLPTPVETI